MPIHDALEWNRAIKAHLHYVIAQTLIGLLCFFANAMHGALIEQLAESPSCGHCQDFENTMAQGQRLGLGLACFFRISPNICGCCHSHASTRARRTIALASAIAAAGVKSWSIVSKHGQHNT